MATGDGDAFCLYAHAIYNLLGLKQETNLVNERVNLISSPQGFEESREHLGVETQRQRSDPAIARSTPVLMMLYSVVCLAALRLWQRRSFTPEKTAWHQKEHVTFSDMLREVRFLIWKENLISGKGEKTPSRENFTP